MLFGEHLSLVYIPHVPRCPSMRFWADPRPLLHSASRHGREMQKVFRFSQLYVPAGGPSSLGPLEGAFPVLAAFLDHCQTVIEVLRLRCLTCVCARRHNIMHVVSEVTDYAGAFAFWNAEGAMRIPQFWR